MVTLSAVKFDHSVHARFRQWNKAAIFAVLAHLGEPQSTLDVGCGDGTMLRVLYRMGLDVEGVELERSIVRTSVKVVVHDLSTPLALDKTFDLVLCIEVGEHLPEEAADTLCNTLARHVGEAGRLVFTAAAPDQNGDGHINCQPQEYWRIKLEARGLKYDEPGTAHLRETWKWVTGPMFWLPQNVQVFYTDDAA